MLKELAQLEPIQEPLQRSVAKLAERLDELKSKEASQLAEVIRTATAGGNLIDLKRLHFPIKLEEAEVILEATELLHTAGRQDVDSRAIPVFLVILLAPAVWGYIRHRAKEGDPQAAWQLRRREIMSVLDMLEDSRNGLSNGFALLVALAPLLKEASDADYVRIGALIERVAQR